MQGGISQDEAVRQSVCVSVRQTRDCDKTKETLPKFLHHKERTIIPVLRQEKYLVGTALVPEILG